jgi:hypothetical protein
MIKQLIGMEKIFSFKKIMIVIFQSNYKCVKNVVNPNLYIDAQFFFLFRVIIDKSLNVQ